MYNSETQPNKAPNSIRVDNKYVPNNTPVHEVTLKQVINHSFEKCENVDQLCCTYIDLKHHLDDSYRHYVDLYINKPKKVEAQDELIIYENHTAKWLKTITEKNGDAYCSQCGYFGWSDYRFCPECGVKMVNENE